MDQVSDERGHTKSTLRTKIANLKLTLQNSNYSLQKMQGYFKGQTILVVSAGPSSAQWMEVYERLRKESDNEIIVFCVKSAIELVQNHCHFHFINDYNLRKPSKNVPDEYIKIITQDSSNNVIYGQYDLEFKVLNKLRADDKYLARTNNYETFTLENTGHYRPPGPGIMHASVIYTAVHLGAHKIVTVGWDIADDQGANTHFYDKAPLLIDTRRGDQGSTKNRLRRLLQKTFLLKIALYIKKIYSQVINFYRYNSGKPINPALMFPGEAALVAKSIPQLKTWLNSKSIELEIVSDSKWMNSLEPHETQFSNSRN